MDVEACLQAVVAHYPRLSIRNAVPIEAGWDSFVLDAVVDGVGPAGGAYIFRFPRRRDVQARQAKETALLSLLASRLSTRVPTPELIWHSRTEDEIGFLGYQKIPGEPLSSANLDSPLVAAQLGRFLTELHSIPPGLLVSVGVQAENSTRWQREQLAFYAWTRSNVFPALPAAQRNWAAWLWESYLGEAENFKYRPCLIHSDLVEEHILVNPKNGGLTGVIDWGDARLGDAAIDFTGLLMTGGKGFVERVLDRYSGPGFDRPNQNSFWARMIYYARLFPFHYFRHGMTIGDATLIQHGRAWLEALAAQGKNLLDYSPVPFRN